MSLNFDLKHYDYKIVYNVLNQGLKIGAERTGSRR